MRKIYRDESGKSGGGEGTGGMEGKFKVSNVRARRGRPAKVVEVEK